MMKIFRTIRRRLLADHNLSKYLPYAVGEILLVVIGILIALQINNWNETRNQLSEMSRIYVSLIDELENDDKKLREILPDFEWKLAIMKKILRGDYTAQDWVENDSLFLSFFSFEDFTISRERFQLLKSKIALGRESRQLNNRITDFYNKHSTDIEVRTHEANMSYHRNIEYWEENEGRFNSAIVEEDYSGLGNYAVTSPVFKNKLIWYRIMLLRLTTALRKYQLESGDLVADIKEYIQKAT